MISFVEAISIYELKYPENKIIGAIETQDEWVISAADRESGLELDSAPIAISKVTGDMKVFFPPANREKIRSAIPVKLELYQ